MLKELHCVWNALFGESNSFAEGYNVKLLNTAIATEYINKDIKNEIYSLKRILQLVLDSKEQEFIKEALGTLFKLREELITTFKEVSEDSQFEDTLMDAIKLIIIDAFNRNTKGATPISILTDVREVCSIKKYVDTVNEVADLAKEVFEENDKYNSLTDNTTELEVLEEELSVQLDIFNKYENKSD